jgi:hypothetical protein
MHKPLDYGFFVAAIYNCYSEAVHWQEIFLLLLYILEAQWGYDNIKKHGLADTLKFWKGVELKSIMYQN